MNRLGKFWRLTPGALVAAAGCVALVGMLALGFAPAKASKDADAFDPNPELGYRMGAAWDMPELGARIKTAINQDVIVMELDPAGSDEPLESELLDRARLLANELRFNASVAYAKKYRIELSRGASVASVTLDSGEIIRLGQRTHANPLAVAQCIGKVRIEDAKASR
jgi:hypothetical protein